MTLRSEWGNIELKSAEQFQLADQCVVVHLKWGTITPQPSRFRGCDSLHTCGKQRCLTLTEWFPNEIYACINFLGIID